MPEVYSQVTTLFDTAPDLLQGFHAFLPETAISLSGRVWED
jgi:histone deacetylase complex regulatory component SIN3